MRDPRVILHRSHHRLVPLTHRADQSYIVTLIVETILILCACADGPQSLGFHIAKLALGKRHEVRPARRPAFTERRRSMGGQITLDQAGIVAGRDMLRARADGRAVFEGR